MRKGKTAAGVGLALLTVLASTAAGQRGRMAAATVTDAQGRPVGEARFREVPEGVEMTIQARQLTPGAHGIHVHDVGQCHGPDFASAGPHFNPTGKHHGLANAQGPHLGDMPNLVVASDGTARATVILAGTTLHDGPASLLKPAGTALVIHGGPDDQTTDPAGNSGPRVACGVIHAWP